MKLLVLRHAAAVSRGTPGVSDDDRPLTARGRRRFRRAARGLARIMDPPDVMLTSPLPRAAETARIAAQAWGGIEPAVEPALAGDNVHAILAAVQKHPRDATVALVGHEPALSSLLARLLGSTAGERFALRKGGAALVDLVRSPATGGRLVWYLRPRILRTLGRT